MSTIVEKPDYELINEGICNATLGDVEDLGVKQFGKYPPKDYLKLTFITEQLAVATGRPLYASCLCTKTLGRKSKLGPIIKALTNSQVLPKRVDVSELIGKKCRLSIVHEAKEDGNVFANVAAIFPVSTTASVVATTASLPTVPAIASSTTLAQGSTNSTELGAMVHAAMDQIRRQKKEEFTTGTASSKTAAEVPAS